MNLLSRIGALTWRLWASMPSRHHSCCVCAATVTRFLPYRNSDSSIYRLPEFVSAMGIIGSDVANFGCPRCGASDRERHLHLYLRTFEASSTISFERVLHFAPERHLQAFILARSPQQYVKADLFPSEPGVDRVNMLHMPYADESFDLVIANHVLEHVADDVRALAEVARVLAPGGSAILQTPFAPRLMQTFEDEGIDSDQARHAAYGQADHVRLYGRDIFARIEAAGFENHVLEHPQVLAQTDPRREGVNAEEPFFLFRKRAT